MYSDFFITCSGANKEILSNCPTEKTKFVGIGATIFLTAVLAAISGGYVIYFTFHNVLISLLFGLLWGFIIFNLDRYIVLSIRKTGNLSGELWTALPRFLIAIVLAITISKPLELKLFDGSILKKMGQTEDDYNKSCEDNFNNQRAVLDTTKASLQNQLARERNDIYLNDPIYKDLETRKVEKVNANAGLSNQIKLNRTIINANSWNEEIVLSLEPRRIKQEPRYNQTAKLKISENRKLGVEIAANNKEIAALDNDLKSRRSDLASQVKLKENQYSDQISGVQNQIADLNNRHPEILAKCKADAALDKDVLARLRALSQLKSSGGAVMWASLLITFLFVFLETAPIIVKLLSKRGPYDEILDRIEYEIFLEQQKIISDRNDEVNNILQEIKELNRLKGEVRVRTEKAKLDAELKANEDILNDIVKRQGDLAKIAIDRWYEVELDRVNRSPIFQHAAEKNHRNEHLQAGGNQTSVSQVPTLEGIVWRAANLKDEIFYHFKNGYLSDNELEYQENGIKQIGYWEYLTPNREIKVELPDFIGIYILENLTNNSVTLKSSTNDKIELVKY